MGAKEPTIREALRVLGIEPPKVSRDKSQTEINRIVDEWKKTSLKTHYHSLLHEHHPDKHDNSPESNDKFREIKAAYEVVKRKLQLRKPPPPPSEVKKCLYCSTSRVPEDAIHCHECGKRYELKEKRTECPACSTDREPVSAKFCHYCGYDYQAPDPIVNILRSSGVSDHQIGKMAQDGTLRELREMGVTNPKFRMMVNLYSRMGSLRV